MKILAKISNLGGRLKSLIVHVMTSRVNLLRSELFMTTNVVSCGGGKLTLLQTLRFPITLQGTFSSLLWFCGSTLFRLKTAARR